VKWHILSIAHKEAVEAAFWYDEHLQGLGDDFVTEYAAALGAIEKNPLQFSRLETAGPDKDIRRVVLKRYAVIYEALADEVVVLAVGHTSRAAHFWHGRDPT
jgi:plasmid stabilization system protein ParE